MSATLLTLILRSSRMPDIWRISPSSTVSYKHWKQTVSPVPTILLIWTFHTTKSKGLKDEVLKSNDSFLTFVSSLPQNFLKSSSKLRSVSLSHNNIQHLLSYQFSYLPQLNDLDISNNNITTIHKEAFGRIGDNLRKLFLHNNNLKSLSATVLLPMSGLQVGLNRYI